MNLTVSDVLIIVAVIVGIAVVALYMFNKKSTRRMIQAQDFIDQNRMTTQIFVIDKRQEKPTVNNLPKAVVEQMPRYAKMRKVNLVRAKVGPQIVTLLCDKPVYNALTAKKTVKVDIAGLYIVGIIGLNLENKKDKTFTEKMSVRTSQMQEKQTKNAKK